MKIDGIKIAGEIFKKLRLNVKNLKEKGVIPTLGVILVGKREDSLLYVSLKKRKAKEIGAKVILKKTAPVITVDQLTSLTKELNNNPQVHGLIIQRPLPYKLDPDLIQAHVSNKKDVDGLSPNSPFTPPVALAILEILKRVYFHHLLKSPWMVTGWSKAEAMTPPRWSLQNFKNYLASKKILVIGRGETAGKPIIKTLKKLGLNPSIAHSKTENIGRMTKQADIIISGVGKKDIIRKEMIKKGVILIGVGLHRGKNGKWHGDYNEEEIKDKALYYTPAPGGVGPLNVAFLMENLVVACQRQRRN